MLANYIIVYLLVLIFSTFCGLIRYKILDKSTKIVVWYITITTIVELLGWVTAKMHSDANHIIYNLFSPIQFLLLSLYFNSAIRLLKKSNIGIILGLVVIAAAISNFTLLGASIRVFDNKVTIVSSFLLIAMSLILLYELLASDDVYINLNANFWFGSFLLIYWSFTFFYWLLGLTAQQALPANYWWISIMLSSINILTYTGFAIVLLSYKKMRIK